MHFPRCLPDPALETMSTPPFDQTDTHVFWSNNEGGGWMHVLPSIAGLRVLCVQARGAVAWMLAREAREVTRLYAEPIWPASGPGLLTDSTVRALSLDDALRQAKGPGFVAYDALVIHDPNGAVVHRGSRGLLQQLLAITATLISSTGFVYIGARNGGFLQHLRRLVQGEARRDQEPLHRAEIVDLLKLVRPSRLCINPFLMGHRRVIEVLGREGYRATKNRELLRERMKERVFGPWGSQRFAPAFGFLALRDGTVDSAMEQLTRRIGVLRRNEGECRMARAPVLKQYLVFSGHKAIMSAGPPDRDDQDVIAVLTGDVLSTLGRETEAPYLDALMSIDAIAPRVPRPMGRFAFGQTTCFAMERVPGLTVDAEVEGLEKLTDEMLGFLLQLHEETTRPVSMDDTGFMQLIEPLLEAATLRNPDFSPLFREWSAPLRTAFRSHVLPSVFQHGDFKVENMIYEPKTNRLKSVIDWEHARIPGLPLLDVMYLLVYNRIIRGARWHDAMDELIVCDRWSRSDRARLDLYRTRLGIEASLMPAFRALFMAHHIGCRIHLQNDSALRAKVAAMLVALGLPFCQNLSSLTCHTA